MEMELAESRADMQAAWPGIKVGCAAGSTMVSAQSGSGMQQFGLMDDEIKDGEGTYPKDPRQKKRPRKNLVVQQ